MRNIDYNKLHEHVASHPFPLLFATISGAHLYGFPSADSDFDIRGVHLLPLETVVGLDEGMRTVEKEGMYDGLELDLVTHDAAKFFGLMLRRNGYVLEQLFSPLVVHQSPEFEELRSIARNCITKHHAHHYLGFAARQWRLVENDSPPRVKPLLYAYRVLLTGIHLMRTGDVEANLTILNQDAKLTFLDDLISIKTAGPEKATIENCDLTFFKTEYMQLTQHLETAHATSNLPEQPTARDALNNLLVRLRLGK